MHQNKLPSSSARSLYSTLQSTGLVCNVVLKLQTSLSGLRQTDQLQLQSHMCGVGTK